jgi:hypothetical protein
MLLLLADSASPCRQADRNPWRTHWQQGRPAAGMEAVGALPGVPMDSAKV